MTKAKKAGCLVAAVAWCVILLILGVAYKFLVAPYFSEKLTDATGSDSRYTREITLTADSFSGYAVLRSPYLRNWLSSNSSVYIRKWWRTVPAFWSHTGFLTT